MLEAQNQATTVPYGRRPDFFLDSGLVRGAAVSFAFVRFRAANQRSRAEPIAQRELRNLALVALEPASRGCAVGAPSLRKK